MSSCKLCDSKIVSHKLCKSNQQGCMPKDFKSKSDCKNSISNNDGKCSGCEEPLYAGEWLIDYFLEDV